MINQGVHSKLLDEPDTQNEHVASASYLQETMASEDRLIRACASQLELATDLAPEWFAYFEDSQAFSAPKADVLELLRSAPTPFAAGLMYGIYLMRQELALMTGRDFV